MTKIFLYPWLSALILGLILAPLFIPVLRRLRFGQMIRREGPEAHLKKSGTPTMGGVIFVVNMVVMMLFWGEMNATLLLAVVGSSLYALLGFLDDFIKTVKKRSLGLRAYQKFSGEILFAIFVIFFSSVILGRGDGLALPFYEGFWHGGWIYYLLAFLLVAGATNGVNLTDGLDGLAAGCSFIAYTAFGIISLACIENPPFPNIDYQTLTAFAAVMSAISFSFLFFNHYPAKVFMGDTGSLFLGGGLAILAILTGTELLLIVIGGVFVLETLSVMIQVLSFKLTGKRVFKMAPLHHHFEECGWKETKVVAVFWTAALAFAVLGLCIYFL